MQNMPIEQFIYTVLIIAGIISFFFILLPEYLIKLFKNIKN